jgi:glycosyltransferase involved in cell wall biosynthesis
MSGIKVCITTLEFPPDVGGVGESVKRISGMLADQGHEVHVVVFHSKRRKEDATPTDRKGFDSNFEDGIFVHRYQSVARTEVTATQDYLSDVHAELRRLHDREHFDLFHGFYLNETGFLTTLLAKEVGKPVINSIRGADIHRNVFNPKQHSQILWALEHSDWLTFVSRELEQRAHILAPSTRQRTSAFWNSIVPIDFDSIGKPATDAALSGTVIGSFGNFRDKKGIDFLIWACRELAEEIDLTLLLVGDFIAKEKAHWEEIVGNSGIADRIVVTGRLPREQALAYHHVVDIFAIPSLRDGCPNALMEAMLAGQAIVGSGVDAIGEILSHDEDALVVEPGSTQDLVTALRRLAQDPQLRQRLGSAARNKVCRDLSPAREQENWLTVYNQVVSSTAPCVVEVKSAG